MIVIGIHNTGVSSSAAIVINGKLKFGYLEERISRIKYDKFFPYKALEKILLLSNKTYEDVDVFAISWNPAINIGEKYRAGFSEWPGYPGYRLSSNPNHILPLLKNKNFSKTEQIFGINKKKPYKIFYVSHHLSHAANAFFASGFKDAIIFTCDAYGEKASTCWFYGQKQKITQIGQIDFPHSIGMFYSTLTEYLGFRPYLDEWKIMGASAYGNTKVYFSKIRKLFIQMKGLNFKLNLEYFNFYNFDSKNMYNDRLIELLGAPRRTDEAMKQRHFDIAAAVQKITEEYFLGALKDLKGKTNSQNICISGGAAMNSVVNGIISMSGIFKNVFVPFAPDDSGNSIGAALWVSAQNGILIDKKSAAFPFLGKKYSKKEILKQFTLCKLKPKKLKDIYKVTAELLAEGKIVGWFQGSMEFGQRALGCRSILADPRNKKMKDLINNAVKFRESFRPFAPAILENFTNKWFQGSSAILSPYMEKVLKIKKDLAHLVPAVVHIDGSCRLQTVTKELTPEFYTLINEFYKKTKIPMLLNTSFNINNEPIVDTPGDAIRTFFSSGVDAIVIGPYLMKK